MRPATLILAAALAALLSLSCRALAADQPYEVQVWADASYDLDGKLSALDFPQKTDYPAAFLENLRARVAAQPATPYLHEGQPATLETGVLIKLTVTPGEGGGSVSVDEIELSPRVLRMTVATFPADVSRAADWDGTVLARCQVTVKGRCGPVDVIDSNGMSPESVRRFAKASLEGWRFKPQRVNGRAIESEIIVPLRLRTEGLARPVLRDRQY